MEIIDERGNLFGKINVIDALVVLLVLSVVLAGVGLVLGSGGSPAPEGSPADGNGTDEGADAVRYATVDLGTQPVAVAERLSAGDRLRVGEPWNGTITDVYVGPTRDGSASVTARVRLDGRERNESGGEVFAYRGSELTVGDRLSLKTNEYHVNGTVTDVAGANDSLRTADTPVVLTAVVSPEAAATIDEGDEYRLAGRTVGTVESVETYPTGERDSRRVAVGMTLRTIAVGERPQFGTYDATVDSAVTVALDEYDLKGTVSHRGNASLPGEPATATAVVELEDVSPAVADAVTVGATERADGRVRARVLDKSVEPATVVVTGDDGQVYSRDHPERKDVTLTVELSVRRTERGTYFHGRPLHRSDTVSMELDGIRVEGTVIELRDADSGGR